MAKDENGIDWEPSFKAKMEAHAAKFGPWVAMKTLLGGQPDCNRRTIYHVLSNERGGVFNAEMREWTPELESALAERLELLNSAYLMGRLQEFAHATLFNEPGYLYCYKAKTMPNAEWEAQGYSEVAGQPLHPTLVLVRKAI